MSWPDLDFAAGLEQRDLLTNVYVEALRVLAPDSGAYINEVRFLSLVFPNPHLHRRSLAFAETDTT